MKLLFLSFLVMYSCSKNAKLQRETASAHLEGVTMKIAHLSELKWPAGFREEAVVSQSITFTIDMPKVNQDDLDYLISERDVDSWIIRVMAYRNGEKQDLGSLYSLFRPKKLSRTSTGAASSVALKIYYAAAYASERWRNSKCPPLGHNKKITEMKVEDTGEPFDLSIGGAQPYNEKSQLIELTPSSFNAGMSMAGEYSFEIAPYNSQKKMIHAPFKTIPGKIIVAKEESVPVPSCNGVHPEYQPR
ncbi:MAG: hypothetical protein ACJ76H_14125 [Bacteriovoracaceae bacterium]